MKQQVFIIVNKKSNRFLSVFYSAAEAEVALFRMVERHPQTLELFTIREAMLTF